MGKALVVWGRGCAVVIALAALADAARADGPPVPPPPPPPPASDVAVHPRPPPGAGEAVVPHEAVRRATSPARAPSGTCERASFVDRDRDLCFTPGDYWTGEAGGIDPLTRDVEQPNAPHARAMPVFDTEQAALPHALQLLPAPSQVFGWAGYACTAREQACLARMTWQTPERWHVYAAAETLEAGAQAPFEVQTSFYGGREASEALLDMRPLFGLNLWSQPVGLRFLNTSARVSWTASSANNATLEDLYRGRGDVPFTRGVKATEVGIRTEGLVTKRAGVTIDVEGLAENGDRSQSFASGSTPSFTSLGAFGNFQIDEARRSQINVEYNEQTHAPVGLDSLHTEDHEFWEAPLVAPRILGPAHLEGRGLLAKWLNPLPGTPLAALTGAIQDPATVEGFLDTETDPVFTGGRPTQGDEAGERFTHVLLSARAEVGWRTGPIDLWLGASCAFGPNGKDTDTLIYGADLRAILRPCRGTTVTFDAEWLRRDYEAPESTIGMTTFPAADLIDEGGYAQVMTSTPIRGPSSMLHAGLRYEYTTGAGNSIVNEVSVPRGQDPFRADHQRWAPNVRFDFGTQRQYEVRATYYYDISDAIPARESHSFLVEFSWWTGKRDRFGE